MELSNDKKKDYEQNVRELVEKLAKDLALPSEQLQNRLSVGSVRSTSVKTLYWQPHHLRLYFDFNRFSFNTSKPTLKFGSRFINGSEFEVQDFMQHRIVVKKNSIEMGNKIEHKRWYVIRLDATSRVQQMDIYVKKAMESLFVLKEFIKEFGGVSEFKLLNYRGQFKIQNEEVINKLPLKLAFNNEITSKVYNEPNIEVDEPMASINYIENAALKTVQPEICSRLDGLHSAFDRFTLEALNPLTEQIKLHLEVQRETLNTLHHIQEAVSNLHLQQLPLEHPESFGSPLFSQDCSVPPVGVESQKVHSFPLGTLSKDDVALKSKAYRLFRARQLLNEFGWGESRW